MQVDALLRLDWKEHVPDQDGQLAGNDLENLRRIIGMSFDMNPQDQKILKDKCQGFFTHLKSMRDYVKAMRISAPIFNFGNKNIRFSDMHENVHGFVIEALLSEYPIDSSYFKLITSEEFNNLAEHLYPTGLKEADPQKAVATLVKLGIPSIETLSFEEALTLLKRDEFKQSDNEYKVRFLTKTLEIIKGLNPRNRNDFKIIIDFSQAIDVTPILGSEIRNLNESDNHLANLYAHVYAQIIPTSTHDTEDLNILKSILLAILNFINVSIPYWIEVDRKFLFAALRHVPNLLVKAPENPPEEFWNWISSLTNLESIIMPKSTTWEQFNLLPASVKAIDISHCIHLDGRIIPHLEKLKVERLYLTTPADENVETTKDSFSKEELARLKSKIKLVYDGTNI